MAGEEQQEVAGNSGCQRSLGKGAKEWEAVWQELREEARRQEAPLPCEPHHPTTQISRLGPATVVTHFLTLNLVSANVLLGCLVGVG